MNGYIAFYNGKRKEVLANTIYEAQLLATAAFQKEVKGRKRIKSWDVNIGLAEVDGKQVTSTITN